MLSPPANCLSIHWEVCYFLVYIFQSSGVYCPVLFCIPGKGYKNRNLYSPPLPPCTSHVQAFTSYVIRKNASMLVLISSKQVRHIKGGSMSSTWGPWALSYSGSLPVFHQPKQVITGWAEMGWEVSPTVCDHRWDILLYSSSGLKPKNLLIPLLEQWELRGNPFCCALHCHSSRWQRSSFTWNC